MPTNPPDVSDVFEQQRGFLWGYCYRLSGDAATADDLVQETFVRAMERPPADTSRPWRPWLVRVATNLAHDEARRSKRLRYVGPWLPSPVRTDLDDRLGRPPEEPAADRRVELLESASIAFLLALEALSPSQRAVLLLRDVYDYSVDETAEMLDLSAANVKTTLHRARKRLETYDAERVPLDAERIRRTGEVLHALLERLAAQDLAGVEALLAEHVVSLADGNGRFYAAKVAVDGASRVARLYTSIAPSPDEPVEIVPIVLNHLPAIRIDRPQAPNGFATRLILSIDIDRDGRIARLYSMLSPEKLGAIDKGRG